MKAAQLEKYTPKMINLKLIDTPKPKINDNEVLVKVLYAAVNPADIMLIHGELKLLAPFKFPKTLGCEMVGVVEQVGANVKNFRLGDRVFGGVPLDKPGSFTEYVALPSSYLAKVPNDYTNEEAAAIPVAALTVMQVMDLLKPTPGNTIFISGGTGAVGMIAIPIAKDFGLKVIVSGNEKNKEKVIKLGASQFINYKTEDFSKILHNVDYVLDTVGNETLDKAFEIIKPGGHIISLKGIPNGAYAQRMNLPWYKKPLFKAAGNILDSKAKKKNAKYDFIFVQPNGKQLEAATKILEENNIHPYIDKIYDLDNINDALKKVAQGSSNGKTLIKVSE